MTEDEKNKTIEKWSKLGLTQGIYENQYVGSIDPGLNTFDTIQFPMVKRVMSATLAGGGTYKSQKQQLKENRMNKLRKLQGEEANITLPDDVIVEGLVSVQPMSSPVGVLLYMDYKYGETEEKRIKKQNIRKEKLEQLFRKDKIKYIVETLKNNLKKWMT